MANPNNDDWSHFYNNQPTTTTTTTASVDPESRRVSKPTRRRSRASRRTPTTLYNTDTTNFRAMVQQFTGGPSAVAFGSPSSSSFSLTPQAPWQQYANSQNQTVPQQQQAPYMLSSSNHFGYPSTVVSDGFATVDERRDGEGGAGGGSSAPSPGRNSNITSWLQ